MEEIFLQTPADKVDEAMAVLKRCRPPDEVCRALYKRIGAAPLGEFEVLKAAYFKHCEKYGVRGARGAARRTAVGCWHG